MASELEGILGRRQQQQQQQQPGIGSSIGAAMLSPLRDDPGGMVGGGAGVSGGGLRLYELDR